MDEVERSVLSEIPDEEKASLVPGAGTSAEEKEPKFYLADEGITKEENPNQIRCLTMVKIDDNLPPICCNKTFVAWGGLKKHQIEDHPQDQMPVWKKGRPAKKQGYDGFVEDVGPQVMCRCIQNSHFVILIQTSGWRFATTWSCRGGISIRTGAVRKCFQLYELTLLQEETTITPTGNMPTRGT